MGGAATSAGDVATAEGARVEDGGAALLEGGMVAEGDGVATLGGGLIVECAGVTVLVGGETIEDDGVEAEGDRGGVAIEDVGVEAGGEGVAALGGRAVEENGGGVAERFGRGVPEGPEVVTLMATFWPDKQWPGMVHMKKCWPAVVRVILAGGTVEIERGLALLHESKAVFVTLATSG
ncbi:hypothetical protein NL676_035519 [Syzygium grande]|nr:hypothetical protein NL676_035519 [Syzygium grande]